MSASSSKIKLIGELSVPGNSAGGVLCYGE